jgi:2-(1,2-epoxy-1,2-dihydrophenyl)acetyl-CoA isomerase
VAADIAEEWGMIWRAVDDDRLMPEAQALMERLTSGPTVALGLIKQALDESGDNDLADQLDLERDLQIEAAETPDHAEGVRAFLEKRPPVFTGRRDREN